MKGLLKKRMVRAKHTQNRQGGRQTIWLAEVVGRIPYLTIVGLRELVNRMPGEEFQIILGRGDGDRSQGCTGPRGRTLSEDQARLASQFGVTSE
jgi:hypothetical protein